MRVETHACRSTATHIHTHARQRIPSAGEGDVTQAMIGAALVGTFAGIFFSYGVFGPIAAKVKYVREKQVRVFVIVKSTLIAYMNGAMPQVALEYGRKVISAADRPTIDQVENETIGGGSGA